MYPIYPMRMQRAPLLAAVPLLCACAFAAAGELVYAPVNPAFGGNNASAAQVMLSTAQATNKHKGPDASPLAGQSALQQFNDMLERTVLGQLAAAATSSILGPNGKLVPGTVETGNFRITIVDLGGGVLQITTTDKTTGASTSFQIGT